MLDVVVHQRMSQGVLEERGEVRAHQHAGEDQPAHDRVGEGGDRTTAQHRHQPLMPHAPTARSQEQQDGRSEQENRGSQHHQDDVLHHMSPEERVVVGTYGT